MLKRGAILSAERVLLGLKENDCKLLVRVDGFKIVGIVSKIRREYDSGIGRDRQWAMGINIGDGGKVFDEPLDRKNPKTGHLEPVIVRETPFMMITARKTTDPKDDDNNFTWLPVQFHLDMIKELEDELVAQQRVMNRIDEEYRSQQSKLDLVKRDCKIAVDENQNLKSTVDFQSKKLVQLERENQEMYTLLQRLRGHGLEVEGELAVELQRAMERGKAKAHTPHEIRMTKLEEDEAERQKVEQSFARHTKIDMDEVRNVVKDELRKVVSHLKPVSDSVTRKPIIKQGTEEESESPPG